MMGGKTAFFKKKKHGEEDGQGKWQEPGRPKFLKQYSRITNHTDTRNLPETDSHQTSITWLLILICLFLDVTEWTSLLQLQ